MKNGQWLPAETAARGSPSKGRECLREDLLDMTGEHLNDFEKGCLVTLTDTAGSCDVLMQLAGEENLDIKYLQNSIAYLKVLQETIAGTTEGGSE